MEEEKEETLETTDSVQQETPAQQEDVEQQEVPELTEEEKEIERLRHSPEAKWYVIHTYIGYENIAKENLETVVEKYNLQKRIFDIVIPMEDVIEEKNGKKKLVSKKITPNYIFVKMIYGDDLWHNVTRTRGITGFTGPKGRPLSITEDEIRRMHLEAPITQLEIAVDDKVEVIDGPLMNTVGTVLSVDKQNSRAKVVVEMFGRDTPVDLDFSQIKKF